MTNHHNRSGRSPYRNPTPDEIRAAREAAGLTQEAAAGVVRSSRMAWQKWELAERKMHPGLWRLFKLEVAQGCAASDQAALAPSKGRSR